MLDPRRRRPFHSNSNSKRKRLRDRERWSLAPLEPRLLLAGDAGAAVTAPVAAAEVVHVAAAPTEQQAATAIAADKIVFIDSEVADHELLQQACGEGEIVLLLPDRDAMSQISEALATRTNVGSVHIISHGDAGRMRLGGDVIDAESIRQRADQIASWSRALSSTADILLYGCEVGAGSEGDQLLRSLASITGADVAASIDVTGAARQGGNWALEKVIGTIEAGVAFEATIMARYQHTLPIGTQQFNFTGFSPSDDLQVNGGASITGDALQLTSDARFQRGSAFFTTPLSVDENTSFQTSFSFEMTGGFGAGGADGLTFTLQNDGAGTGAIGRGGGGLGYEGIGQSLTIEFDTWQNRWDGFNDEIAVTVNGVETRQIAQVQSPVDLNSGDTYFAWIDYDSTSQTLSVFLATEDQKPATAALTTNVDLASLVGDKMFAGFTASNYDRPNAHSILSWQMTTDTRLINTFVVEPGQLSTGEGDGQAIMSIRRTGDLSAPGSVAYETSDLTAVAGLDYLATSGVAEFAADQAVIEIPITILDDGDTELIESFALSLSNPDGGELGNQSSGVVNIADNEQALPMFSNFAGNLPIDLNGGASITGGKLQLTSDARFQTGSAFFDSAINVDSNTSFQTAFSFEMTGGAGEGGADGLTFVLQNSAAGSGALGRGGSGLGYEGIDRSVTIEFDTWQNRWDATNDEIAITIDGVKTAAIAQVQSPFNLNSGRPYYAWVDYDGASQKLSVFLANEAQRPANAVLTADLDLQSIVGDQMFVGFTSANYDQPNAHSILSWGMTTNVGSPQPGPTVNTFVVEPGLLSVGEDQGQATLRIRRTGDLSEAGSVAYETIDQTATAGLDYVATSGVAEFSAGQEIVEVPITILDDGETELIESLTLSLSNPVNGELGSQSNAVVSIADDEQALPMFSSFAGNVPLDLNGGASLADGKLEITSDARFQTGSAFFESPISIDQDTSFQTAFSFEMTGGSGAAGADGLTFVLQNSGAGSGAIGRGGGGLGYEGIDRSVIIEFDTWQNRWDSVNDEVAVTVNGVKTAQLTQAQSPFNLNSGDTYFAWIDYDASFKRLEVYLSSSNAKPEAATVTLDIDLMDYVGDQFYAGFTASNYDQPNAHRVLSWSMALGQAEEGPGVFGLETNQITVNENASQALVRILRAGGASGEASINYTTYEQSASEGIDYQAVAGTAFFADGQTVAEIYVPLLNDDLEEGTETFSITIDNPEGADLGTPRTATVTILDDEQALPAFGTFTSSDPIILNGSANVTDGKLEITPATNFQTGSAFFAEPIELTEGSSFKAGFSFEMAEGAGIDGADGITFILQNSPDGTGALGRGGSGMGFEGIGNSVAVTLDTYANPWNRYNDEIGIVTDGSLQAVAAQSASPVNLNGGGVNYVWIDYNGDSNVLAVYVSDTPNKPSLATAKATVELDQVIGDQMYVGFSSSTYDLPNAHRVLSWWMNTDVPIEDPPVMPSGEIVTSVVHSGLIQPTAIDWSPDGRNMYVSEKAGVVKVFRDGQLVEAPLIDISRIVNNVADRGLLDVAVHPDLENNPYLYLLYAFDPPEVWDHEGNAYAGHDQKGNRAGQLMRITLDASTNYTTMIEGSDIILLGTASTWDNFNAFTNSVFNLGEPAAGLNPDGTYIRDFINSDSTTHTVAALEFAPDGSLLVSVGDGGSYNQMDPRVVRVQDIDSLSGKILRIDPITGEGLSDNPFFNGDPDANRSKVYQLGLRNPFRIAADPETGRVFIGDVGWTRWEEINTGDPGTNFGWPYYEGGEGENIITPGGYIDLPEGQEFLANGVETEPAIIALNHNADGINAVIMGDVIRGGDLGLLYEGDILFNDLGQGIVRRASVNADGEVTEVSVFTTGARYVVDMQQGPDGEMYYVNLAFGEIGQWLVV